MDLEDSFRKLLIRSLRVLIGIYLAWLRLPNKLFGFCLSYENSKPNIIMISKRIKQLLLGSMILIGLAAPLTSIARAETRVSREYMDNTATSLGCRDADYRPKYYTTAHQALELESELSANSNYRLIDEIIDEVRRRARLSSYYSKEEATSVFQTIDNVLINFLHRSTVLLSDSLEPHKLDKELVESIRNKEISGEKDREGQFSVTSRQKAHVLAHPDEDFYLTDCDALSLIYYGVGEVLDFPIRLVGAPGHTFVRWHFSDGNYLNWETTCGETQTNEFYEKRFNISDISIRKGVFLSSLNKNEVLNYTYSNRGQVWSSKGDYDRAIDDYTRAIELYPKSIYSYFNRGNAWLRKGNPDEAIANYTKAIELHSNFQKAYYHSGHAWFKKGNFDEAIANYTKAIELDPKSSSAYYYRGIAWSGKGEFDRAILDHNKAVELDPKFQQASFYRRHS
ncbi:MAG: hypothetical protein BA872_02120 [Desulfobacterales bacterium C00003060]|nr:MAG: hypothetical protein BA861_02440 [Desulfobacterales bacterium S3730MH5]OEU80068.1 MAG: hypothetical protein BA872_02120 [Desulfobacterales bacterium C00003060]